MQLLDLLSHRHEVKDRIEAFALERAAQRTDDDNLASLRSRLCEFNNLRKRIKHQSFMECLRSLRDLLLNLHRDKTDPHRYQ